MQLLRIGKTELKYLEQVGFVTQMIHGRWGAVLFLNCYSQIVNIFLRLNNNMSFYYI